MRTLISTLILVIIAMLIATTIKDDPGHVIIEIAGKTIETSFAFFAFFFLLLFIALNLLIKMALFIYHIPLKMGLYRAKQKSASARFDLTHGLIDLAEGKWADAEKKLSKLADFSDAKLINYLAAARAAQHQKAHSRRDAYLKKAIEKNPEAQVAVGITQAELQLSHNQTEQALATLNWLLSLKPKHIYVKKLLAKTYQKLGDWQKLIELMPELRKHRLFNDAQLIEMEKNAYLQQLTHLKGNNDELQNLWKSVPKKLKIDNQLFSQYCKQMFSLKENTALEAGIRLRMDNDWDEDIIHLYGLIILKDNTKMLSFAENLLTKHEKSPALFLTLGRLCMQKKLWGKAKTYFQQSLSFKVSAETYQELANLHVQLDEFDEANALYRKGLQLLV